MDHVTKFNLGERTYQELFANNPAAALIVAQALPPFPPEMISIPTLHAEDDYESILAEEVKEGGFTFLDEKDEEEEG